MRGKVLGKYKNMTNKKYFFELLSLPTFLSSLTIKYLLVENLLFSFYMYKNDSFGSFIK